LLGCKNLDEAPAAPANYSYLQQWFDPGRGGPAKTAQFCGLLPTSR